MQRGPGMLGPPSHKQRGHRGDHEGEQLGFPLESAPPWGPDRKRLTLASRRAEPVTPSSRPHSRCGGLWNAHPSVPSVLCRICTPRGAPGAGAQPEAQGVAVGEAGGWTARRAGRPRGPVCFLSGWAEPGVGKRTGQQGGGPRAGGEGPPSVSLGTPGSSRSPNPAGGRLGPTVCPLDLPLLSVQLRALPAAVVIVTSVRGGLGGNGVLNCHHGALTANTAPSIRSLSFYGSRFTSKATAGSGITLLPTWRCRAR